MIKKDLEKLKQVFSRMVHERAVETGSPILEVIMELREDFGIEEDEAGKYITDHLRELLQLECEKNYLFKPSMKTTRIEMEE